jgi:propanol-preferring alcohol dehydrogenase
MRAAVVAEIHRPLELVDLPVPEPGPGQVVIRVEACGVCHSDLHIAEGGFPGAASRVVPGHEVVGLVSRLGPGVADLAVGDRVGVAWLHSACGTCELCREGLENLCRAQQVTGLTVNGGFAEQMRASASHAIRVPASLDPAEAAPLFCAGATVYRGLRQARVQPGQRVAVFGVGGLGHLAIQVARALGARVLAADVSPEKLELARSLGAEQVFDAGQPGAAKEIRRLGGAHAAIVTSAARAAYDVAFRSLRPTGTLVVVGLPSEPLAFPALSLVSAEARIVGSAVGTRQDQREVLDLAAGGQIRCQVEVEPLEHINSIFDRMRAGRIRGRVVVRP